MLSRPNRNKRLWIFIILVSFSISAAQPFTTTIVKSTAVEKAGGKAGCDIVFVLDISGSMKRTDANKISIEIMKMVVDICSTSNSRIGFVAYNDTIAYSYELTDVSKSDNAKKLKSYIGKVNFKGETDIGLGLKKAVNLLVDKYDKEKQPIVCLLSDGQTDLRNSKTGRTEEDSEKDVQSSIRMAKEYGMPIYTIGLNNRFNSKVDYLEVISNQTEGISYVAASPFQLLEIINGIIARYQSISLKNETTLLADGKMQESSLTLPNQYVEKYVVVILSSAQLETAGMVGTEKNKGKVKSSKYYSIIEVENPKAGEDITVYYKTRKGASVSVNTQAICNFQGKIETESTIYQNQKQFIRFFFLNRNTKEEIEEEEIYKSLECNFYLVDETTKEETRLAYGQGKKGLTAEYAMEQVGTYSIKVQYQSDFGSGSYQSEIFQVIDSKPQEIDEISAKICEGQSKSYDLNQLFENKLKTQFTYHVDKVEGGNVKVQIKNNQLELKADKVGDGKISIIAQQDKDKYRLTITTSVKDFWNMYQELIVGIAIVTVICLTVLIYFIVSIVNKRKRKKGLNRQFSGSLIGYFVDVKSANDMPPMKWELSKYPGVGITLNTLVNDVGVSDYFMGADRIWIYPKSDTEIEIVHSLKGSIFVGTKLIEKDVPTTVYNGETIYVCFEENGAEIELRYQAVGGISS